jgi:RNA-directed DNA polymerase
VFDRIDHAHLLAQLGSFPARELIAAWLRDGVIVPLLMNVALHG